MKHMKYFMIAVLLIFATLLLAITASAQAGRTPVSGTITSPSGWEDLPGCRAWVTGQGSGFHLKKYAVPGLWETTDPRLNGVSIYEGDALMAHWKTDGTLNANRSNGKETIFLNVDFTEPKWECVWTYTLKGTTQENCQGVGVNQGLKAFLTATLDETGTILTFDGYILEPGGE